MAEYEPQPIKLQGKDYLEVAQRVLWLRQEHPDAQIVTAVQEHDRAEGYALIFCTITIPSTGGIGTGWGSASRKDLRGPVAAAYLEKAETRAKGRACADLGYGTLAALQEDGDTLADAPIDPRPKSGWDAEKAKPTPWSRAADVAIAHFRRLQVNADDEKSLIMELTSGKYRKLSEMHPPEIDRLNERLAQFQTPADLAALRAPGRAESHAVTQQGSEAASDTPARSTEEQQRQIRNTVSNAGMTMDELLDQLDITSLGDLTAEKAGKVIDRLTKRAAERFARAAQTFPDPNSPVADTPRLTAVR